MNTTADGAGHPTSAALITGRQRRQCRRSIYRDRFDHTRCAFGQMRNLPNAPYNRIWSRWHRSCNNAQKPHDLKNVTGSLLVMCNLSMTIIKYTILKKKHQRDQNTRPRPLYSIEYLISQWNTGEIHHRIEVGQYNLPDNLPNLPKATSTDALMA